MNTKNILLFSMTSALSLSAFSEDYVSCRREVNNENFQFRQFCEVKEESKRTTYEMDRYFVDEDGTMVDVFTIIRDKEIELNNLNGTDKITQPLASLNGYFDIDIDFSKDVDCQGVNSLWNHSIQVKAGNETDGKAISLAPLSLGENKHYIDAGLLVFNPAVVYIPTDNSQKVSVSIDVSVDDETQLSTNPLPYQRIPRDCQMNVNKLTYTFDPVLLNNDLKTIKNGVIETTAFMALSKKANEIDLYQRAKENFMAYTSAEKIIKNLIDAVEK